MNVLITNQSTTLALKGKVRQSCYFLNSKVSAKGGRDAAAPGWALIRRGLFRVITAWTLVLVPVAAWADAGTQLARTKQCLACHQVDTKRVGPAFSVIAQRYAGAPGAQQYLADAIRQGSRNKWGAIPMPVQPQVGPADAVRLAGWILSLAGKMDP